MNSFNLAELNAAITSRWKFILVFTSISILFAWVATLFITPTYKASATIIPGNAVLADQSRLFNDDIQHLYSLIGNGDDLDRLQSIAGMDTTLKKAVNTFQLSSYYNIKEADQNLRLAKTIEQFKKDLSFIKTVNNELVIGCENEQKETAAAIVNYIIDQTAAQMQAIWKQQHEKTSLQIDSNITAITNRYNQLSNTADNQNAVTKIQLNALLKQLETLNELSIKTKTAATTTPAALIVLEPASVPAEINWPSKSIILPIAAFTGLIFSISLVLLSAQSSRF